MSRTISPTGAALSTTSIAGRTRGPASLIVAALTLVIALFDGGISAAAPAAASGGTSVWPVATAPLPDGTVISSSSTQAVVRTTDTVQVGMQKLDAKYVALGWTVGAASGKPRTYTKTTSGKTVQIVVFFAALDPVAPANYRAQFTLNWTKL